MEYRINLDRMEFHAYHGCYDLEQVVGNHFTVDLVLTTELGEVVSAADPGRAHRNEGRSPARRKGRRGKRHDRGVATDLMEG